MLAPMPLLSLMLRLWIGVVKLRSIMVNRLGRATLRGMGIILRYVRAEELGVLEEYADCVGG